MDPFIKIYSSHGAAYHQMIACEDADGNLLPALKIAAPLNGARLLDLGSGTGRIPILLQNLATSMVCLDLHSEMLREQASQRDRVSGNWAIVQGDMRTLPFPDASFDVVTAGWAIGHFTGWYPKDWRARIETVLGEMERVVTPGTGAIVILETLTTGSLLPAAPTEGLAQYYGMLENEWGFTRQQIRTDYQFVSVDDAIEKTGFFFGPEMSAKIKENGWDRLPEWTGVWSKKGEA